MELDQCLMIVIFCFPVLLLMQALGIPTSVSSNEP
jgi:hypothetical protein